MPIFSSNAGRCQRWTALSGLMHWHHLADREMPRRIRKGEGCSGLASGLGGGTVAGQKLWETWVKLDSQHGVSAQEGLAWDRCAISEPHLQVKLQPVCLY